MASVTDIANMALSHLGIGKEVSDITTERSQEALACLRFYETARDATLRDFPWPFATKFVALGLIAADPTEEWDFSYTYPTDCLRVRRILSGDRNDDPQSRIVYKIVKSNTGKLIYTDKVDATIEYTPKEADTDKYPADFVLALSLRLAAYIAPRLTGGDPFKLGDRAFRLYQYELSSAEASSADEGQMDEAPDAEWVRER